MKKVLLMIIVLLGVFFMPFVYAEEIPKSGVTYFLMYPDGSEEVTENYNDAMNKGEKLIYSDVTNEEGMVGLCNFNSEGEIRVVQHVPDGYTTNVREMKINLSKDDNITFVDYRGLVNPGTGNTIVLIIIMVLGVVGITILSRKNKSTLMIIPCLLLCFIAYKVQAYPEAEASHSDEVFCFPITVEDGKGDALPGVQIDVYATPVIDAQSAVKFDANGGYFFDGTTEMYFRLPFNGCTMNDLADSLDGYTLDYFDDNSDGAYREGYYPDGFDYPDTMSNGTVVPMLWDEDSEASLIKIVGNGGFYPFYYQKLNEIYIYASENVEYYTKGFVNEGYFYLGLDRDSSCSVFPYGTGRGVVVRDFVDSSAERDEEYIDHRKTDVVETYYLCWSSRPDGIYVDNDVLFRGNVDTCFNEANLDYAGDYTFSLKASYRRVMYPSVNYILSNYINLHYGEEDFYFSSTYGNLKNAPWVSPPAEVPNSQEQIDGVIEQDDDGVIEQDEISPISYFDENDKLEIVYKGVTILSTTADEWEAEAIPDTNSTENETHYHITNPEKAAIMESFLSSLMDKCLLEE